MKKDSNPNKGLTKNDKILIFLLAPFYVLFGGVRSLYHLPGNDKQNKQALILYFKGLAFWIIALILTTYLIENL